MLIGRPSHSQPISYVDVANDAGAGIAAEHLVNRGCRRIAMVTGPDSVPASQDRLAGFRAAMARLGRAYFPSVAGNFTHDSGEAAMHQLLAGHPDIDGVFAANDLMAQGALVALREAGRAIPDDVAVIGFDDSSAATAARPALTTVRQPLEDMAAEAARMLLARVDDPGLGAASVIFEPTLVRRQSA